MYKTMLATSAAALFVATSAFAQTTMPDWSGSAGAAFFTDDTMSTARTEAEIQSAWESLSEEERAQVQEDCSTMTGVTASGGSGDMPAPPAGGSGATGGSSEGTGTDAGADGGSGSETGTSGESATTGSPTATETAMGDVCETIATF